MTGRRWAGRRPVGTASRVTSAVAARSGPPGRACGTAGRRRAWGRGERGSFTAELAAGLPALVLLLLAGLTAVDAVTTRAGCLDAAREAALAAARGEPGSATGAGHAPSGATVSVTVSGDRVVATVRAPVRSLGARLPRIEVTATAVAAVEPGTPGPRP